MALVKDDWVYSPTSNAHVCNDPRWFCSLVPFESETEQGLKVTGVGCVPLYSVPPKADIDYEARPPVVLNKVLLVPETAVNIVGQSLGSDYTVKNRAGNLFIIESDGILGHFSTMPCGVPVLQIPFGRTTRPEQTTEGTPVIQADWSEAENKRHHDLILDYSATWESVEQLPYSPAEKLWLKQNYTSEFYFLRCCDMGVWDPSEREYGRAIVRQIMHAQQLKEAETPAQE